MEQKVNFLLFGESRLQETKISNSDEYVRIEIEFDIGAKTYFVESEAFKNIVAGEKTYYEMGRKAVLREIRNSQSGTIYIYDKSLKRKISDEKKETLGIRSYTFKEKVGTLLDKAYKLTYDSGLYGSVVTLSEEDLINCEINTTNSEERQWMMDYLKDEEYISDHSGVSSDGKPITSFVLTPKAITKFEEKKDPKKPYTSKAD